MIYGYIRVSSDKQTVENQRFEINNFCSRESMTIDGWIEETISGTKSYNKRELGKLLKRVGNHDITFIIFAVIALLFLGATLYLICCIDENRHSLRELDNRLTEGHNKLAGRLLEQEQSLNRIRRAGVNNFKLTCKVGVETGVLPADAVKDALEGMENFT